MIDTREATDTPPADNARQAIRDLLDESTVFDLQLALRNEAAERPAEAQLRYVFEPGDVVTRSVRFLRHPCAAQFFHRAMALAPEDRLHELTAIYVTFTSGPHAGGEYSIVFGELEVTDPRMRAF